MKKIVRLFLVLVMVLSVSVTAFAATPTVKPGEKKKVTLKPDEEKKYSFTVPQQGIYKLSGEMLNNGSAWIDVKNQKHILTSALLCTLSEEEKKEQEELGDIGRALFAKETGKQCELYFCAEKAAVITVELNNLNDTLADDLFFFDEEETDLEYDETAKLTFTVKKFDAPVAKSGENTVSEEGDLFLFVPAKSGKYNFRSSADKQVNPNIEIAATNGKSEYNDDNGFKDDYNFDLTMTLKKGKAYAIACENVPANRKKKETKEYSFRIAYNEKIDVEKLELDMMVGNRITLIEEETDFYFINIIPNGSIPYADVDVAIENEEIVTFKMGDDGDIYIRAKKPGKTTLTLTDVSGVSAEYKITVLPKSLSFLWNIVLYFRTWISTWFYGI